MNTGKALKALFSFVNSDKKEITLTGLGGSGKSYLINMFLKQYKAKTDIIRKLHNTTSGRMSITLTATTNAAADELGKACNNYACTTIHSRLSIYPYKDTYRCNYHGLRDFLVSDSIIIIDEASYLDEELMQFVYKKIDMDSCKIIYVGDKYQLPSIYDKTPYIFDKIKDNIHLTTDYRAIHKDLKKLKYEAVKGVEKNRVVCIKASKHIIVLPKIKDFKKAMKREFLKNEFAIKRAKIKMLTFTNNCTEDVNSFMFKYMKEKGKTNFIPVVVNVNKRNSVIVGLNHRMRKGQRRNSKLSNLQNAKTHFKIGAGVENDVQYNYSETIHKAQGASYSVLFIDLDDLDIRGIEDSIVRRLLYVALTRPRRKIYITGSLDKYVEFK